MYEVVGLLVSKRAFNLTPIESIESMQVEGELLESVMADAGRFERASPTKSARRATFADAPVVDIMVQVASKKVEANCPPFVAATGEGERKRSNDYASNNRRVWSSEIQCKDDKAKTECSKGGDAHLPRGAEVGVLAFRKSLITSALI